MKHLRNFFFILERKRFGFVFVKMKDALNPEGKPLPRKCDVHSSVCLGCSLSSESCDMFEVSVIMQNKVLSIFGSKHQTVCRKS